MCNVAPRGVYVCGNTSTSSGLTVTLSRDGASGDFALEAGALVLGDQGTCNATGFILLYVGASVLLSLRLTTVLA